MADITQLKFVHEDGAQIVAECKAYYESLLNRQLAPADVEMLLVQGLAYRELIIRAGINDTARQNLVQGSRGAALEYLGQLVGVTRLPASEALCTIQFALIEGHTGVVIPQGLRVQSLDGKAIFRTIEERVVPTGTFTASILCACQESGKIGNGYAANTVTIILDPQSYLITAQNTDETKGGADDETDEELRERIILAPSSFSVAGPTDAYKFFAKSAHPSIVDVAVTSPVPGQVNIYPLLENGELPSEEILDAVQAICNADKIRPLTDTVITAAPTVTEYEIEVELTLLTNAVSDKALADATAALNAFVDARKNRLGLDVIRAKLTQLSMAEGVYNANVISPASNVVVDASVYTKCTGVTVTIGGTHDE